MQRLNLKRLDPAEAVQLLAGHYIRLLRWAAAEEPAFVPNSNARVKSTRAVWAHTAGALTILFLISTTGYFAHRHKYGTMDAAQILQESIGRERASLEGQTEHQVAHIEEISADGRVLQQATMDAWKDGDGLRYIRRLYNAQHRTIAEKWRNQHGDSGERGEGADGMNGLWDQDLSAQEFAVLGDGPPQVRLSDRGYELTRVDPTPVHSQLLSATLVLNRNLQPIRQIMRVRARGEIHELRFELTDYERKPSASVPDRTFSPESDQLPAPRRDRRPSAGRPLDLVGFGNAQLAELQIGVLYDPSPTAALHP